ncbi:MAG: thiamine phosphate synthase [Bacteroidales bacterium]|nr:thiamine phosphate synthase [Candidatus Minthousia equi]
MAAFQFITHYTDKIDYLESARLVLEGGCKWVQLRMKNAPTQEIITVARQLRELCDKHNAIMLLDDHVELVKLVDADGVHLGKNDMPINQAREVLGPNYIIGGTANTFEDVVMHWKNGADYIGCGPFRFTTTKEKLSPVLGLEGYASIVSQMKQAEIHLPIVAIGGITADDIPSIIETGVTGIALSGTVLRAEDPIEETRKIIKIWKN